MTTLPQLLGVLRAVLAALGGWAVSQGYIDEGGIEPIIGAAIIVVTAVWSWRSKRQPPA